MAALILAAEREAYSIDQIRNTMTVGELMAFLEQFDEDTPIYLSHDRGYTYGAITESRFEEDEEEIDFEEEFEEPIEDEYERQLDRLRQYNL